MYLQLHFTRFFSISLALHALLIVAALFFAKSPVSTMPVFTPVNIIDLPQQTLKRLPPIQTPREILPQRQLQPSEVPMPKKFGKSDEVLLPKTVPRSGKLEGAEQGTESGKTGALTRKETGPLPFLTQRDIDELARKGMPARKPGDESVTLDTDEFKFISYNRWLKIKVESILRYPELAAISGYQGTLFIKFDILKNGSLGGVEVLKSSGYKILDDEALRAIRASAPYQALPDEWNMERYSIRAAVIFYMNEGYIR